MGYARGVQPFEDSAAAYSTITHPSRAPDGTVFRVIMPDGGEAVVEAIADGRWQRSEAVEPEAVAAFPRVGAVTVAEALADSLIATTTPARGTPRERALASYVLRDAMLKHVDLAVEIDRRQRALVWYVVKLRRRGLPDNTATVRAAKQKLAAAEARRNQLELDMWSPGANEVLDYLPSGPF